MVIPFRGFLWEYDIQCLKENNSSCMEDLQCEGRQSDLISRCGGSLLHEHFNNHNIKINLKNDRYILNSL